MEAADPRPQDAEPGLIDRMPRALQPYFRLMRADRPVGVWLLFLPCIFGLLAGRLEEMTADSFWRLVILFLIGSFVMRSAGCAYNDLVDRDLDAKVQRTRGRPLPSGAVSPRGAAVLIGALLVIGFLVLIQLPLLAILIGLLSLALVAAYPFMKRITWWPQLWLGLTFNWGVLVGSAAAAGTISLEAALVYAGCILWTLGYDTIYALQDIEDDALAGIKSSARRLGRDVRRGVAGFYAGAAAFWLGALLLGGAGAWSLLLVPAVLHLLWQVTAMEEGDAARNLAVFKSNIWLGALLTLPLLAL
ncbi:4-hydroxybenzoate octaprenyltransferase [Parvularcula maris]|uniref:4-hydroxybenzoate octaprenyltransferase n=1 Tax=Parvularcula maris TaxID=2965077 RepID=A0A9X2RL24_9PROT|nr:4-hydroxybenzoate octaprenyltransferase [Parvularcula maris]MCQ8186167.1 4-hydroxybenzoate octaprenyltransferase [Parvularcula maris]